jgi:hypothetical protein
MPSRSICTSAAAAAPIELLQGSIALLDQATQKALARD